MNDVNDAFNRVLTEIAEAMKRLDALGQEMSLPEYTRYEGLRIVEETAVQKPVPVEKAA